MSVDDTPPKSRSNRSKSSTPRLGHDAGRSNRAYHTKGNFRSQRNRTPSKRSGRIRGPFADRDELAP
jgi:hypothetical protein